MTTIIGLAAVVAMLGQADADPAMKELRRLVGGTWKAGPVEQRFVWEDGAIRGLVVVGKGTPNEFRMRPTLGWDPHAKKPYYLDQHGANTIYYGHVEVEKEKLRWDFEAISGTPGKWRIWSWFTGDNEFMSSMDQWKDGQWVPIHGESKVTRTK